MADPVIFIVGKLNEYFKTNLTLVDFDEKSPVELMQILNDVLAELEPGLAVGAGAGVAVERHDQGKRLVGVVRAGVVDLHRAPASVDDEVGVGGRGSGRERDRERRGDRAACESFEGHRSDP